MLEITLFYIAATVALVATILAMTRANAIHALIYLIVSLLAVAVIFFLIGAPFAAALEIVIYAGAIMVLFVFVIMMLNLGEEGDAREKQWLSPAVWAGPALLAAVLFAELLYVISYVEGPVSTGGQRKTGGPKHCLAPMYWRWKLPRCFCWPVLVGSFHLGASLLIET